MQVDGAIRGASTIPRRRRLNMLLAIAAIVVIAGVVALMVWVVPFAKSGVGTEDAIPKAGAGPVVIPDEGLYYPLPHGKVALAVIDADGLYYPLPHGKVVPVAVSGDVHDDAGNMPAGAGSAVIHDDAGNVHPD